MHLPGFLLRVLGTESTATLIGGDVPNLSHHFLTSYTRLQFPPLFIPAPSSSFIKAPPPKVSRIGLSGFYRVLQSAFTGLGKQSPPYHLHWGHWGDASYLEELERGAFVDLP